MAMITCVLTGHMSTPIVLNRMYIIFRRPSNVDARALLKNKKKLIIVFVFELNSDEIISTRIQTTENHIVNQSFLLVILKYLLRLLS